MRARFSAGASFTLPPMATETPSDDLVRPVVPSQLGRRVAVLVAGLFIGMIVAAIVGGVDWLIGIGGGGTALGTLGLAYFTFTVAQRTTVGRKPMQL